MRTTTTRTLVVTAVGGAALTFGLAGCSGSSSPAPTVTVTATVTVSPSPSASGSRSASPSASASGSKSASPSASTSGAKAPCTDAGIEQAVQQSGTVVVNNYKCSGDYAGVSYTVNGVKAGAILKSVDGAWTNATGNVCGAASAGLPPEILSYCTT